MGTDQAELATLLDLLVSHRVKRYENSIDGAVVIELHPPEPEPVGIINPVPKGDRGKIDKPDNTPYHTLFGGDVPNFRAPNPPAAKG